MRPPSGRRLDRAASLTAHINAAQRAAESMQPASRRLLDDPYARHFAGPYAPLLTTRWIARTALSVLDGYLGGLHAHIVLRARHADDVLREAVATGTTQLLLLGAGFDTTALRTHAGPSVRIFEVDAPSTQNTKRRIIDSRKLPTVDWIHWIPCDFERDELSECLQRGGFDTTQPCVAIWLGVSFYLSPPAFTHTLGELARLSAPSSRLVLDYGDPELVTGDHRLAAARRATRLVRRRGEPYRSGFTEQDLTATLNSHGYAVRDHARVPELVKRYAPQNNSYAIDDWLGISTAQRLP